jgi:hypothetical protein
VEVTVNLRRHSVQDKAPPAFRRLAALEPGLDRLLAEARSHNENRSPIFCANAVFYGYPGHRPGIKQRLSALVGWGRKGDPVLGTCEAYDVAYETIYEALPNCRGRCRCSVMWAVMVGEG